MKRKIWRQAQDARRSRWMSEGVQHQADVSGSGIVALPETQLSGAAEDATTMSSSDLEQR
jgi:hypothetical protein